MGSVRNPMAAVHEIIRQGIGDLTIGTKGSQHDWQLLAAAGNITKAEVLMVLLMKYVDYHYLPDEQ